MEKFRTFGILVVFLATLFVASDAWAVDVVFDFESPTYTVGSLYDPVTLEGQDGWIRNGAQTAEVFNASNPSGYPVLLGSQSLFHYGSGFAQQSFAGYSFPETGAEVQATILTDGSQPTNYFNIYLSLPGVLCELFANDNGSSIQEFQVVTTGGVRVSTGVTYLKGDTVFARLVLDFTNDQYQVFVTVNGGSEIDLGVYGFAVPMTTEEFGTVGRINLRTRSGGIIDDVKVLNLIKVCTEQIAEDLNGDCKVDYVDLSLLAARWLDNNIIE